MKILKALSEICKYFKMKKEAAFSKPNIYLGGEGSKVKSDDDEIECLVFG